jgi:hypothetical protein
MADEAVLIEAAESVASYLDSNAIIAAARYRADLVSANTDQSRGPSRRSLGRLGAAFRPWVGAALADPIPRAARD